MSKKLDGSSKKGSINATNRTLFSQRPTSFDPMDEAQLRQIQEAFARQGRTFDNADEALRYLERLGDDVQGVSIGPDVIFVRPNASASTVFEELIHSGQMRTGRFNDWSNQYGNRGAIALAEYDAAQRLVRFQRQYGITDAEHAINQARIAEFGRQLDELGIPRD